jgi:hypothetical protein
MVEKSAANHSELSNGKDSNVEICKCPRSAKMVGDSAANHSESLNEKKKLQCRNLQMSKSSQYNWELGCKPFGSICFASQRSRKFCSIWLSSLAGRNQTPKHQRFTMLLSLDWITRVREILPCMFLGESGLYIRIEGRRVYFRCVHFEVPIL